MRKNDDGFAHVELIIIVIVLAAVGFVGYKVFSGSNDKSQNENTQTATDQPAQTEEQPASEGQPVKWAYDEQKDEYYAQSGQVTKCREPFKFDHTPVDINLATVIGMPGAYRGFNYKPHGGFRTDNSPDGKLDVKLPIDATLVGLKRYYEGTPATIQYLLTFETDCGIAFRFDHLYTLAPAFQAIAETTPEPKLDDTRSHPDDAPDPVRFKSGDVVATAVGFPPTRNFGFDFGVYDYRRRNEISKNPEWAALHGTYKPQEWFGVCWLDMLPDKDVARAKELSLTVINPQKPNIVSDYCPNAPFKTLQFNGGKPTDG